MEKDNRESLDFFLEKYGVSEKNLSDKEKVKALKDIIVNIKVEEDFLEENYVNKKNNISDSEYVNGIKELDVDEGYAYEHILRVRFSIKESRKLKVKQFFQKKIAFFKK